MRTMIDTVIASLVSFVSTNIDDIFLLMILYGQATGRREERQILAGRYVGTGLLLAVSFLGIFGLQFISGKYLKLLGLVPIALGIKAWIDYRKEKNEVSQNVVQKDDHMPAVTKASGGKGIGAQLLTAAMITISSGADNIGVYIPLFAGYGLAEIIVVIAVFAVMTAVWSLLGKKLADLPLIRQKIQQYKDISVAVIFIILCVYILLK